MFKNLTDEVLLEVGSGVICPTEATPADVALDDWDKPPK